MKTVTLLSILAAALLCGCNPDKSAATETVQPNGGVPHDAVKGNANIPADAAPGAK